MLRRLHGKKKYVRLQEKFNERVLAITTRCEDDLNELIDEGANPELVVDRLMMLFSRSIRAHVDKMTEAERVCLVNDIRLDLHEWLTNLLGYDPVDDEAGGDQLH